jgi:UDP-N-acetylmuramoyl-tripeptide--D-alanyl-D-alanine ligase
MLTLAQVAQATGGRVHPAQAGSVVLEGVATDTRTLVSGTLFVALTGERFDGHDHLPAAAAAGARAALIEAGGRALEANLPLPVVVVDDTRLALGRLARWWRSRFVLPVIAVAGSNGKTTTKEMVAAILRAALGEAAVLATAGNFNNDIGLPLTVLGLREQHRAAVIEIGMNHPGETATLAAIARPTIALITNAQREHQEFMRDVDAVALEHAALIDALPGDGAAVLNADDLHVGLWRQHAGERPVLDYGLGADALVGGRWQELPAGTGLELRLPSGEVHTRLAIPGVHNARNALGAAAAAWLAGCDLPSISRGLSAFRPVRGRMQVKPGLADAVLIDDTYNANPDSVRAAIDVLASRAGRTVLVLGDMGEVGDQGEAFHAEVGAYARARGIGCLQAIGMQSGAACRAFGEGATQFGDMATLVASTRPMLAADCTVLVKGSRFMRMEQVIEALAAQGVPAAQTQAIN